MKITIGRLTISITTAREPEGCCEAWVWRLLRDSHTLGCDRHDRDCRLCQHTLYGQKQIIRARAVESALPPFGLGPSTITRQ